MPWPGTYDPDHPHARIPTQLSSRIDKRQYLGVAAPPAFSIDDLPADAWLTTRETSAVTRMAIGTLAAIRRHEPDHVLEWKTVGSRSIRYSLRSIRAYLAGQQART